MLGVEKRVADAPRGEMNNKAMEKCRGRTAQAVSEPNESGWVGESVSGMWKAPRPLVSGQRVPRSRFHVSRREERNLVPIPVSRSVSGLVSA
jgi:hypothetical protein